MEERFGGKRALIVEGGGLRGAFAVGVLRAILERKGQEAFDGIFAVSAGVFAATYFAAGQGEKMESTWRDRVHGNQLIDYSNVLRGLPVLRLDYLIDLFKGPVHLDLDRVMSSRTTLCYVLTDFATGDAVYFNAKRKDIFDLMRASSALPLVYPIPVIVDGHPYYDGGQSDAIPVQHAISLGFTDLLVVRSRPAAYRKARRAVWLSKVLVPSPGAREAWINLYERYNASLDIIAKPPAGVAVDSISPPDTLRMGRFSRSREGIWAAIEAGKRSGERYLDSGGVWGRNRARGSNSP